MRRSVLRLTGHGGAFALCATLRSPPDAAAPAAAPVKDPKDFKIQPMQLHARSTHMYEASAQGAEVGARNEAACMNYEAFKPHDLNGMLAMPHLVNLLTITPLYCAIVCVASVAWGIVYWDLYCRRTYETVLVARPESLR
ncbi:succinate dehydrogenase subunit [Trypanosoma rangeli]|uniref:Succinate dehydrogenase subunit n=1 Tax=Trypanosoma rangeli TaxID=5698 RepID=A0A3R7K2B2_TRYRA|nr:succinate dehydrogenase subunit [Trypanosoma rangeli]RNF00544.1 succinate dehydrogenase subunit [Trypanosoma rangeli]|eukprot:RNF00544.1 succinate dehydrogenase subunit [Trypanosoma rangeli]